MNSIYHSALVLLLLLFLSNCKSQSDQIQEVDPILERVKETSLYSDDVNWDEIEKKYSELKKGKSSIEELKPSLEYLLNSIGDKHAVIRSPKDFSIIAYYTGPTPSDHRDPTIVNEVINDINAEFSYQLLPNKIGYLRVVGIAPQNISENAQKIRNGIIDLYEKGVQEWILDLRYNGGGDMNPMIAGLAPIIGQGYIGGSIDKEGEAQRTYEIRQNEFYDNDNLVDSTGHLPVNLEKNKVAVLLSRYTISSGEMTAITFKGRDNTIFIGEPTAGYTTGNGWDHVSEDILLTISQSVFIDRNQNVYQDKVGVDVELEFQTGITLEEDSHILKAIEWLKK